MEKENILIGRINAICDKCEFDNEERACVIEYALGCELDDMLALSDSELKDFAYVVLM